MPLPPPPRTSRPPSLLGVLVPRQKGSSRDGRSALALLAFCPGCRQHHEFDWPPNGDVATTLVVEAPCTTGPHRVGQVSIALEPAKAGWNMRILREHQASLRPQAPSGRSSRPGGLRRGLRPGSSTGRPSL
jgi:hypothetical protein